MDQTDEGLEEKEESQEEAEVEREGEETTTFRTVGCGGEGVYTCDDGGAGVDGNCGDCRTAVLGGGDSR